MEKLIIYLCLVVLIWFICCIKMMHDTMEKIKLLLILQQKQLDEIKRIKLILDPNSEETIYIQPEKKVPRTVIIQEPSIMVEENKDENSNYVKVKSMKDIQNFKKK